VGSNVHIMSKPEACILAPYSAVESSGLGECISDSCIEFSPRLQSGWAPCRKANSHRRPCAKSRQGFGQLVLYWMLWPMEVIVVYIATIVALCLPGLSSLRPEIDRSILVPELGRQDPLLESTA
jgi:hypothetical protein